MTLPTVESYFSNAFTTAIKRSQMFKAMLGTTALLPDSLQETPETMYVSGLPEDDRIPATHVLAVRDDKSPPTLFAVHLPPLLANCTQIDWDTDFEPEERDGMTPLPVLQLVVPSPSTFQVLLSFFYTLRMPQLSQYMLPLPSDQLQRLYEEPISVVTEEVSCALVKTLTHEGLLSRVIVVRGVYENACALGAWDESLWKALGRIAKTLDYTWMLMGGTGSILRRVST